MDYVATPVPSLIKNMFKKTQYLNLLVIILIESISFFKIFSECGTGRWKVYPRHNLVPDLWLHLFQRIQILNGFVHDRSSLFSLSKFKYNYQHQFKFLTATLRFVSFQYSCCSDGRKVPGYYSRDGSATGFSCSYPSGSDFQRAWWDQPW